MGKRKDTSTEDEFIVLLLLLLLIIIIMGHFLTEADFLLYRAPSLALGPTQPCIQWVMGLFTLIKSP